MTVTVTSALAGPATARYSNIYGALVDLGVLSGLGAQDVTGSGDPVAPILNASQFYAPLTHSLVLTRGTGDPTFTRATSAWEFDNEGKLILVPSGAARFGGARMVRNLLAATGTLSTQNVTTIAASYTLSFYGTGSVTLSGTATGTLNGTGASTRVQTTVTATAGTLTLTVSGSVTDAQLENVTGQADQTASEYVSAGVLSAPYHGAGVDGVKWFATNKDGSAISASSLLGYHAEGARTNSLLHSRDLTNAAWIGEVTGSELVANGEFGTDASGWSTYAGSSVAAVAGVLVLTSAGAGARTDTTITTVIGKAYTLSVTATASTGGTSSMRVGTSNNGGSQNIADTSITIGTTKTVTFVATATTTYVCLLTSQTSGTASFDNVIVKQSAVTPAKTATGIDNVANSASTLTAAAADATILQTLSLAAAARSSSAYVKRRTGSGNIYFTRDGGTTWTDITASVGASWTRVKIENTSVLNPSVGFKIATSGDAIDVDVCQDEAGAFISSPIVTTTAAVTRNADTLNYPKASNLNNTAGTALLSWSISQTGATVSGTQVPLLIDANGFLAYIYSGAGFDIARSYDGTAVAESSGLSRKSTSRKQATNWTGATQKTITEGAAAVDSDTYDGTWGAGSTIQIGQVDAFFGYVRNAYIWSTALTDAQLQQVTA